MTPTEFHREESCVICIWHNVVITIFAGAPSMAHVTRVEQAAKTVLRNHDNVLMLVRLGSLSKPPEKEARDHITQMMQTLEGRSDGWALVIEAGGFLGAALRSVAAGMSMVSNKAVAQRPFKTLAEGCEWLARLPSGYGFTEVELEAAVEMVPRPTHTVDARP